MTAAKKLSTSDKIRLVAPLVVYALLAFGAWKLGYFREQNVEEAARSALSSVWVNTVFVLIFGVVGALALPLAPLAYGAGAVFGFWRGSILIWIGSMIAAVAGYYLARGVLAKPARRLLGSYEDKLHDLRQSNVFLTTFRFQVMPLIPFGVFNYAAAVSKLSLLPFLIGTAFGIIPETLMGAFIGDRFAAAVHGRSKKPFLIAGAAALIIFAASYAPKLWQKLHKKNNKR